MVAEKALANLPSSGLGSVLSLVPMAQTSSPVFIHFYCPPSFPSPSPQALPALLCLLPLASPFRLEFLLFFFFFRFLMWTIF